MAKNELDPDTLARIRAQVDALPPLTDEQCEVVADLLAETRLGNGRWNGGELVR